MFWDYDEYSITWVVKTISKGGIPPSIKPDLYLWKVSEITKMLRWGKANEIYFSSIRKNGLVVFQVFQNYAVWGTRRMPLITIRRWKVEASQHTGRQHSLNVWQLNWSLQCRWRAGCIFIVTANVKCTGIGFFRWHDSTRNYLNSLRKLTADETLNLVTCPRVMHRITPLQVKLVLLCS